MRGRDLRANESPKKKTAPDGAHIHTDGHGDSMTNSAQWGRVGENSFGF